jgi:hypothetical protein
VLGRHHDEEWPEPEHDDGHDHAVSHRVLLPFAADAVIRSAKGTDQHLVSTVVSKSDEAPIDLSQIGDVVAASAPVTRPRAMLSWPSLSVSCMFSA